MFQPTQILRDEHDVILRGLELLESCSTRLTDGQLVSPDTLDSLIEFFRLYADKTHHGKEEALLFPAMVAKGFSYESGPIHCSTSAVKGICLITRNIGSSTIQKRRTAMFPLTVWESCGMAP